VVGESLEPRLPSATEPVEPLGELAHGLGAQRVQAHAAVVVWPAFLDEAGLAQPPTEPEPERHIGVEMAASTR
jgi:hypothetical protein